MPYRSGILRQLGYVFQVRVERLDWEHYKAQTLGKYCGRIRKRKGRVRLKAISSSHSLSAVHNQLWNLKDNGRDVGWVLTDRTLCAERLHAKDVKFVVGEHRFSWTAGVGGVFPEVLGLEFGRQLGG